MSKIRYLWDNKADEAALVASSQATNLPVENIQHALPSFVWRTKTKALEWVELDLGSALAIKSCIILNHNFYNSNLKLRLLGSELNRIGGGIDSNTVGFWDWMYKDGRDRGYFGNDLTLVNSPQITWNSQKWGAQLNLEYSSSQYAKRADDPDLNMGTEDFTLMAWIKTSYSDNNQGIICKKAGGDIGYQWTIITSGKQWLTLKTSSGTAGVGGNSTSISDGNPHHLAVVVKRSTNQARFYLDGQPDGDWQDISAIGSASLDNSEEFYVGRTPAVYFEGYLGIVRVVKGTAVSETVIQNEYNGPSTIESLSYHADNIVTCFTEDTKQFWRLEFSNVDNPEDYLQMGRVFLGGYFESSRQFARGWEEMLIDPSVVSESEGGQQWVDLKQKYRLVRVEFPEGAPINESDREGYREMLEAVGCSRDLFVMLDYDHQPNLWTLYGKFAQTEFNFREFLAGIYSSGFDFKESR